MDVVGGRLRWDDVIVVEGYVAVATTEVTPTIPYSTMGNDRDHARLCAALSTHILPQYLTNTPTTPYGTPKGEDHDWDQG